MNQGVAWVGMRVGYNALAKKRRGIIPKDRGDLRGTIIEVDGTNHLGGHVVSVKWDDGETWGLSPWWLKRVEWAKGGYRHGKRKDEKE